MHDYKITIYVLKFPLCFSHKLIFLCRFLLKLISVAFQHNLIPAALCARLIDNNAAAGGADAGFNVYGFPALCTANKPAFLNVFHDAVILLARITSWTFARKTVHLCTSTTVKQLHCKHAKPLYFSWSDIL